MSTLPMQDEGDKSNMVEYDIAIMNDVSSLIDFLNLKLQKNHVVSILNQKEEEKNDKLSSEQQNLSWKQYKNMNEIQRERHILASIQLLQQKES